MIDISTYVVNKDFIFKEIGGNYVAVDINSAKYFTFNDSAAFFMKCLVNKKNAADIKEEFFAEFDAPEDTFSKGFDSFIKDATSKNIFVKGE